MAREDEYYEDEGEYEDYEEGEGELEQEQYEKPAWLQNMPFFAVSAIFHLILLLIVGTIIMSTKKKGGEDVVAVVQARKKPPPPYDPKKKRAMKRTPKIPNKIVKQPVVKRKLDEVTTEIPKGTSLDNMSNVNQQSTMINDAIGVGGGAAGAYGHRYGKGSLVREGGGEGTESAVLAALEWLYRHQAEDGGWKAADFNKAPGRKGPSANKNSKRYPKDTGFKESDVGVTGLAILAFTGFGHTHRDGEYDHFVKCLRKAVKYMVSQQDNSSDPQRNGRFGPLVEDGGSPDNPEAHLESWIYNHSIATMAMAELLLMSNDYLKLKKPVQKAVQLCLRSQNDGRGWRYGVKPGDNDTSVTGWMVLALKTAKGCRLGVPKESYQGAFRGALKWFDYATASNGKTGYNTPGDAGSMLTDVHPEPYPYSKDLSCMTAVGVLCRLFAGERRTNESVRQGVDILMAQPPRWQDQKGRALSTINLYYWYYATYAMFQFGGKSWKTWNDSMQKALLNSQRAEYNGDSAEVDGSWDPIGEWGIAGGRVYSTAIGAMTLEVYYRFERQQEGVGL